MRRWLACILLALMALSFTNAIGGRVATFFQKGYSKNRFGRDSTVVDSIPNNTAYRTAWIPVFNAAQITAVMQSSSADPESILRIEVAAIDTGRYVSVLADSNKRVASLGIGIQGTSNNTTPWAQFKYVTVSPLDYISGGSQSRWFAARWFRLFIRTRDRAYVNQNAALDSAKIRIFVMFEDGVGGEASRAAVNDTTTE